MYEMKTGWTIRGMYGAQERNNSRPGELPSVVRDFRNENGKKLLKPGSVGDRIFFR